MYVFKFWGGSLFLYLGLVSYFKINNNKKIKRKKAFISLIFFSNLHRFSEILKF